MSSLTQDQFPVLTLAERDRRFALARQFMEEHNLDVLIMTGGGPRIMKHWCTNQFYLSNEPDGQGAVVIFPRESAPVLLLIRTHYLLAETDRRDGFEPWIDDIRLNEPPTSVVSVLKERKLDGARAGVIAAAGETPAGSLADPSWQAIQAALPSISGQDVAASFTMATLAKSEEELEMARAAGRASERAGAALVEAAGVGVSEVELYAAAVHELARGGLDWQILLMVLGQQTMGFGAPRYLLSNRPPRTLEAGDLALIEFFPTYRGVDTQFQMTLHIGEPSDRILKLAEVNGASYEAGIAAIKPGARFDSVWKAMQEPIFDAGYWDWDPLIHSLPMQLLGPMHYGSQGRDDLAAGQADLPPWPGWDSATTDTGSSTELKPGMLFAVEPGAAIGDDRMLFGGLTAVAQDGHERITSFGGQLHVAE